MARFKDRVMKKLGKNPGTHFKSYETSLEVQFSPKNLTENAVTSRIMAALKDELEKLGKNPVTP